MISRQGPVLFFNCNNTRGTHKNRVKKKTNSFLKSDHYYEQKISVGVLIFHMALEGSYLSYVLLL